MLRKPPTYGEFAQFWQAEYCNRKGKEAPLKQEWAYMNFLRDYGLMHPEASKEEILSEWEKTRRQKVATVEMIMRKIG